MGVSVFPAPSAASKTMFRTTLTSGTSYTVPAGVTYLNVILYGGGGAGGTPANVSQPFVAGTGMPGAVISSTLSATAGATITYAIGAGGNPGTGVNGFVGGSGGNTTCTGATTASGGAGGAATGNPKVGAAGTAAGTQNNGGSGGSTFNSATGNNGGAGGAGKIDIEYWA
jgi:hypothetical protein